MAKRKANKSSYVKSQPKVKPKDGGFPINRLLPIGIIAAAVLVLAFYAVNGPSSKAGQQAAPPVSSVDGKTIGVVDVSKAKVTTFKMDELSGQSCFDAVAEQLTLLGGVGRVRADYYGALCEVEYDPAVVTEEKIMEAFSKAQHPGKVTGEKIAAP